VAQQPGLGFAELLRQLRAEARLTQEELAEAACLSPRSVSDLERGIHQTARKDTAGLLAGALGLAEPARTLFVAAARGRAPVAEVLTALRAEAAPAAPGGAMPAEAERAPSAPPGVVPRQLPAGAGFFAGREAELRQLDALLDQAGLNGGEDGAGGAVVISAVAGMAGVGKTALAVHWARKVAGRFPDGQLYVNLRGYDAAGSAVTPEEATGWFLAALGVPASQIPADAPARCGLYRSVLAGRRVLIVLDNARDAAQVRPLLPGSAGCLVVVTSRSALAGLAAAEGARRLRLGPLAEEEGARLLAARLGPERVAAEPGAVAELAAWCGGLPLALAVMAARAAADPGLPLGVLPGQLAGAGAEAAVSEASPGRLEVQETGDPATSLRELLSWSCRQLSPPAAQMFGLVGVHCGPDITVPAAASLAAVPRAAAGRALAELTGASLAAEHRPGRYVLHDLVRGYAAGQGRQALGDDRIRAAIERSLDHYLHTRVISSDIPAAFAVAPSAPGVLPEELAGEAALQDWTRAEHQVVLQAIAQAAATGFITHAWQIFCDAAWFLGDQGYWADIRAAGQAVLVAAEAAGDQVALGWTQATIGRYGTLTGADDEDRAHAAWAVDHFRRAADPSGQAWAHLSAAVACFMKGDWAEAASLSGRALALSRQAGNQAGQGWALAGLGECHAHLGNYDLARGYARQALDVTPGAGDPTALAFAWHALGLVHARLGEPRQAIGCYRQALALVGEPSHALARWMRYTLLVGFGDACRAAGDLPAAVEAWQQARQILRDLGWPENRRIRARLEHAGPPSPPG
jgi:tetratricopeptide (TPR) repeat protein/transcriptional regulator with XRE-family HTH domain